MTIKSTALPAAQRRHLLVGALSALALNESRAQGGLGVSAPFRKISVISFGGGFNLPIWAAQDQGLFERRGLDVQHTITADSKQVFTGMMDGRYHVAITAFDNILAYQEGQGEVAFDPPSDFFAFMGSDDGFLSLVAAPSIKSFADLRGKTISVDAMGNGFSFVLRDMLARNGIAETDVRWARAGGTDRRFAALMAGEHDATMLRAPFDLQARSRGFNQLATTRDTLGNYLGIVGAARRSWAAEHADSVIAFIKAYRDAVALLELPGIRGHAQELLMRKVPGMDGALAARSCELLLDPASGFYADVRLDERGVQAVMALRSKLGGGAALTDASRYMDRRYWLAAQR